MKSERSRRWYLSRTTGRGEGYIGDVILVALYTEVRVVRNIHYLITRETRINVKVSGEE